MTIGIAGYHQALSIRAEEEAHHGQTLYQLSFPLVLRCLTEGPATFRG